MTSLRTHLTLARASNLPTVWSNILCAWIITHGYTAFQLSALEFAKLASFLLGGTFLYTGGMYLNDFCDRGFDALHRKDRPIPAGEIAASTVRNISLACIVIGLAAFAWTGLLPAVFAAGLAACIVIYDFAHKNNPAAPLFMAACRALLYLAVIASSTIALDALAYIAAGTAFVYVMGVTYLARTESTTNAIDYPTLAMIGAPILGAFYYRSEFFDSERGAILALFVAWIAIAFLRARVSGQLIIGKTIAPLLAAIPILDLLILSSLGFPTQNSLIPFVALFALTTAAQRLIPAT